MKGKQLNIPLIPFRRRAALIDDFDTALAMLHLQFNLPYPDSLVPSNSPRPTLPSTPRFGRTFVEVDDSSISIKAELQQLMDEMSSTECVEWALLIATVLLDSTFILTLLKQHSSLLWSQYQKTLSVQEK